MKFNLLSLAPDSFILGDSKLVRQFYPKKILTIPEIKKRTCPYSCNNKQDSDFLKTPWGVEIHLTSKCPLRCKRCSYQQRNKDQAELSKVILQRILKSVNKLNIGSIIFSGGGEPLFWAEGKFQSVIKPNTSYSQSIATNGLNIKKTLTKTLLSRLDIIQINVSGYDKRSYYQITQRDQFSHFMENMNWLFKNRTNHSPQITGKVVVDSDNYKQIKNYLEFCHQLHFDLIVVKLAGNFEEGQHVALNQKQKKELRRLIYESSITDQYHAKLDAISTHDNTVNLPLPKKCWIAEHGLYLLVRANGDVYPCVTSPYTQENSIGNLYASDLEEIWKGARHRQVINKLHNDMVTGKCNLDVCRHMRYNFLLDEMLYSSPYIKSLPTAAKMETKLL